MILYLTSDPGGAWEVDGHPKFRPLENKNAFLTNIKYDLKINNSTDNAISCLVIAADPNAHALNDEHIAVYKESFEASGINLSKMDLCDGRNIEILDSINSYDLLFLIGGRAPVQNSFFADCRLKEKLKNYDNVILSMSAGSMNCAKEVYLAPEEDDDVLIPINQKFKTGLALTDIQIVPHYQYLTDIMINDKGLIDHYICNDSMGHEFVALCDGSYFRIENNASDCELYGEAYGISNGEIWRL